MRAPQLAKMARRRTNDFIRLGDFDQTCIERRSLVLLAVHGASHQTFVLAVVSCRVAAVSFNAMARLSFLARGLADLFAEGSKRKGRPIGAALSDKRVRNYLLMPSFFILSFFMVSLDIVLPFDMPVVPGFCIDP